MPAQAASATRINPGITRRAKERPPLGAGEEHLAEGVVTLPVGTRKTLQ
jgi:hypothetical protein